MTALLTGIVLVLVICHSPKAVINIYECYQVNTDSSGSGFVFEAQIEDFKVVRRVRVVSYMQLFLLYDLEH